MSIESSKTKASTWRRYANDGLQNRATTAQLVDIGHTINTDAAKVLGYMVLNTTTGVVVFASGATDGAVWHYYDGTTAHTPA